MAKRKTSQSEHDKVVNASASTYPDLEKKGYKISVNPNGEKNLGLGPDNNKQYPDVIVGKPESPGSGSGTAEIIEEIETEESVSDDEAEQWKDYADLGIKTFRLIVPKSKASDAKKIVEKNKIAVNEIWYYTLANGSVNFTKY